MRIIIYGVGAVGGSLGVSLAQHDNEVILISRGAQYRAIRDSGLTLETPAGSTTARLPVVEHPAEISFRADDVVILAMKSQDTEPALRELAACAPQSVAIVCMQNGVVNERAALRRFPHVYGAMVVTAAKFVTAGAVAVAAAPKLGVVDLGRYPSGTDEFSDSLADCLDRSDWVAASLPNIMVHKYSKLLENLVNGVQVVVGLEGTFGEVTKRVVAEGREVLERAGIELLAPGEIEARGNAMLTYLPLHGLEQLGYSTWQSIKRGTGAVESDYLNGEIVLVAREHGFEAPLNELVQRLSNEFARVNGEKAQISEAAFFDLAERG